MEYNEAMFREKELELRKEMIKSLDGIAKLVNNLNSTMGDLVKAMEPQSRYYKRINDSTRDVRVIRSDLDYTDSAARSYATRSHLNVNTPRT